ncbi:MAG: penicillin-binding protein 1B [Gammaproteobacteria bacterium]|nr:penicillin-binding protein 1B [Gammaproteobacteria bacterium]
MKKKPKRRRVNRRRSGTSVRWRPHWARLLLSSLVLLLLVIVGYSLYLGKTVRVKFDGQRWAEPARVFARPLELYVGAPVTADQLQAELEFLGYRKVRAVDAPAQWSRNGNRFALHTRAFRFWDGEAVAQSVVLETGNDGVLGLVGRDNGREVDLLRLEPALVGSIYPAHSEDRVLVRREELPESLVQALLAVEDRRFFEHAGIDLRGIARALVANIRAGGAVQGGSTLTQQLVKNFILTPERSLVRKLNEAWMALIVESRYGKDEILEAYANEIFLGQDGGRAIHGFGLAAHFYFQRPLSELRLHEVSLLVGLVKGASFYNPRRHPERALERRNLVIRQMQQQGFIDAAQADAAIARPLGVTAAGGRGLQRVPGFIDLVRRQLRRDYREQDLTSVGLRIFTTLDPWVQRQAVDALASRLERVEKARGIEAGSLQGAVVVAATQSGEVQALVGGRDAGYAGFNRALDAVRPIGSLVKPAVYLAALSRPERFTLTSRVEDRPVDMALPGGQRWQPRNYDREVHGPVMLHEALARSLNLATIDLGMSVGLDEVKATLQALGVEREILAYPSLLLGALSLSPFDATQVYQVLAAGGFRAPLQAIREVLDADQQPLQRYPLSVVQVADPRAVFLLNRNLVEVTESGTARALRGLLPGIEVAGKTGTTNDLRDSWFAGFAGDRVALAWVGRDDNASSGLTGAQGALPVWADLMRRLAARSIQLLPPSGVEYHWVDREGRLSAEHCDGVVAFPYIAGSQPRQRAACGDTRNEGGFWRGLFD